MKEFSVFHKLHRLLPLAILGLLLPLHVMAAAQDNTLDPVKPGKEQQPDAVEKGIFRNAVDTGYTPPNPIDKFIALDDMFGGRVKWKALMDQVAVDVDTRKVTDDKFLIPLLLGIRIADGVMTVKVRSVSELNKCADDIKDMAAKLRVPAKDLAWATKARNEAAAGEWASVFMSLGFMQKKVLDKLQAAEQDQRSLVMISGWIQGLRYSAAAVLDNYDAAIGKNSAAAHPSYQLRDPKLVAWLIGLAEGLSPAKQKLPEVAAMTEALRKIRKIVDINIDPKVGRISKDDVQKMANLSGDIVQTILAKAK